MKKTAVILLSLILAAVWCGCSSQLVGLEDNETWEYENEAGYALELPSSWHIDSETETETSFVNDDATVSLVVDNNLGSVEYYSLSEINDMIAESVTDKMFVSSDVEESSESEIDCNQTFNCQDADGNMFTMEIYTYRKDPSVQYYLVFCAAAPVFNQQSKLIDDIKDSFSQTKSADELYQLITDRRNQEAAAEETETDGEITKNNGQETL